MYKFLSGRNQLPGTRQKGSTKMASIVSQIHLSGLLDVCQTRSLLLRLKLRDKKIGLFLRATGCIFQSAVCAVPWGGSQPNAFSLIVIGL